MPSTIHPRHPLADARPGEVVRIDAAGLADAYRQVAPASMLIEVLAVAPPSDLTPAPGIDARILAVGPPTEIDLHPRARDARTIGFPRSVLIPGLVNAHAHLDLTTVPLQAHDPATGFMGFIEHVRAHRPRDDAEIARAVRLGVALSLAGGVVAVGDIAGALASGPSLVPFRVLRDSPLHGVSFLEFFALGAGEARGLAALESRVAETLASMRAHDRVRVGIQPHASYSASLAGYVRAAEMAEISSLPLSTHLAETIEERELIAHARGPFRNLLERLGLWAESLGGEFGKGLTPVEHLGPILARRPMLLAHVNDADDRAIATLVRTGAAVAYCPRAHEYFHAEASLGPHRYREMLDAGVRVALGTDSAINLPASATDPTAGGISVLDDLRLLHRRDGTARLDLVTTHGALALGMDPDRFTLREGTLPMGISAVAVDEIPVRSSSVLIGLLTSEHRPALLFYGNSSGFTGMAAKAGQQ